MSSPHAPSDDSLEGVERCLECMCNSCQAASLEEMKKHFFRGCTNCCRPCCKANSKDYSIDPVTGMYPTPRKCALSRSSAGKNQLSRAFSRARDAQGTAPCQDDRDNPRRTCLLTLESDFSVQGCHLVRKSLDSETVCFPMSIPCLI